MGSAPSLLLKTLNIKIWDPKFVQWELFMISSLICYIWNRFNFELQPLINKYLYLGTFHQHKTY